MPLDKVLYAAKTHTTGGRDGAAQSDDGRLAVKLSSPGTPWSGTNPEDHDRFVRSEHGWKFVSRRWVGLFARGDVPNLP